MNSSDFKGRLLSILGDIKGSGSFVSTDSKPFLFPGMEIASIGEIGFPITPLAIKELIKVAHKAPFGKGAETVLDATVRSGWEIDAGKISFGNKNWSKFIEGIVKQIKPDLGIQEHEVTANLYKLLIYEKDDFFLMHKDSEKEKGMFGTLIIGLPAKHTGGELIVKFDGRTETVDFSGPASEYKIPYAAFYADCDHEIAPITSGYRVCLTYNLVQQKGEEKIQMHKLDGYASQLAEVLKTAEYDTDVPKIVLLGHQYTPSNYSMEALKLNDRPKAEALILAAEKAGFYAKLGLVTSYQMGELLGYDGYGSSWGRRGYSDYDNDDLAENGEMGEVYDEHVSVGHWMAEGVPSLGNIPFEKEDIISVDELNDGDPIEKDADGYTGNAGMEMTYWYHYGAVFLWPKKFQFDMLSKLDASNKLEWVAYYNNRWEMVNDREAAMIKKLVADGLEGGERGERLDYGPIADFMINIKDEDYLTDKGSATLTRYFKQISVESWLKLFFAYPANCFSRIFALVGDLAKKPLINHLLAILAELSHRANYASFVNDQTDQIPAWLHKLDLSGSGKGTIAGDILRKVLMFSKAKEADEAWIKNMTEAFTKDINREYVNNVLIRVLLESGKGSVLADRIMAICKKDLADRVDNKPQPPKDWSRSLPDKPGDSKIWAILADFLQSPTAQVFDYQKTQSFRIDMEQAIRHVTIDLKMETIKKKSPHTLRLTKTQAAYDRELARWTEDVALLKEVVG